MTRIDKNSSIPKYHQLENIIKDRIIFGKLKQGDTFLSVRQLVKEYSVSLSCVRQALLNLEKEEIVSLEQGKGTTLLSLPKYVKPRNIIFLLRGMKFLDLFCSQVLRGAEQEIKKKKFYHLLYHQIDTDDDKEEEFLTEKISNFKENRVDGIILLGLIKIKFLNRLKDIGLPCVLIGDPVDRKIPDSEESLASEEANFFGGFEAISHLIKLGHKKIAFIGISKPIFCWQQRFNGYRFALSENNIPIKEDWIVNCSTEEDIEEGYKAMEKILSLPSLPTALLTADIRQAIGAMKKLIQKGFKVPEDFSIIAYGNLGLAFLTDPHLTTIEQEPSCEQFGKKAVQTLLSEILEEDIGLIRRIQIAPKLVIRSSTAKPKE